MTNDTSTRDRQILSAEPPLALPRIRARRIYWDFVNGILLAVVLVLLKGVVEHWEFGKQLEQMTYSMLQVRLLSRWDWREPPVTVVDISGLTPVSIEYGGRTELVTPRGPLLNVVEAIARQRPRAIGIDVDFSPGTHGYITPSDPAFLQSLLEVRQQGIPVYVGIYDSVVLDPGKWLGQPEFRSLAAYISVPVPEHREPTTRMVEWVQPAGVPEPCFSLPYALAQTEQRPVPQPLRWAVKRATVKQEEGYSASEFLVDFGPLEKLIAQRVLAENADAVADQPARIADKIVLVGRASPGQSTDQFNVPGRGMPVPGIYLHATATYTLLQAPLYRFTSLGRVTADVLAALLVFGSILLVRLYCNWRVGSDVAAHRLHAILTAGVIVAVLIVGHFLVNTIRLIWTDYLMVIGALLLHSPAERLLSRRGERLRSVLLAGWRPITTQEIAGKKEDKNENGDCGHRNVAGEPCDPLPAAPDRDTE